ncbi:hypothetical protein Hanom_Chr00s000184g01627631 [Helianthus anomalus]
MACFHISGFNLSPPPVITATMILLIIIIQSGTSNKEKGSYTTPDVDTNSIALVESKNDEVVKESTPNKEVGIPQLNLLKEELASGSKLVGEVKTPMTNLSNSKDWLLSSGEKSVSQPKKKLKRLRKFCDVKSGKEETVSLSSEVSGSRSFALLDRAFDRGGRKPLNSNARVFIDDEAEASSEEASDDDEGEYSYGGSFIDDRINPTTQAESTQFDMMAVYRRSLLTQSPIVDYSMTPADDGSASVGDSTSAAHLNAKRLSSDTVVIPSTTADDTKRRKLSFSQGGCGPLPIRNLEKEIFLNPEAAAAAAAAGKEMTLQVDELDDDFLQGIDLDALEAQASEQVRSKSNMSEKIQELDFLDSPSFDLGI